MATIATVAALTGPGKAYAVNAQGVQRELKANDTLEKGETLKTVGDVQVELVSDDMRTLHVNPDQVVKLDDNVFQSEQTPTAADAAVTNTATTETIIQALDRGEDLSTTLEATAASVGDGGGGGGTTFVQLGRISEGVSGNSYGFDYVGQGNLPITQGAATGSNPVVGITIDPITGDNIINNQESNSPNTTISGTVSGDARLGDTVTVTVNGHNYTGTVTSGSNGLGFSIPVITEDLVADPTITASITALGTSGVTATATVDVTVANDTLNARISIDQINGHGKISNTAESVTITGKVKVEYSGDSGTGEERVTLNIGGKEYVATIAEDGSYSVEGVPVEDVVNKEDGSVKEITATIKASNSNGSESTASTSTTPVYDNPAATVTITSVAGDNIINNVEVQGQVAVVGTVGGSAKDGDTVTITVGSGENLRTYTGTVVNGGFSILVDGEAVAGQTITASVSGVNAVGSTYSSTDDQDVAPGAVLQTGNIALDETNTVLTTGGTVTAAVATTFVAQVNVAGTHGTFNIEDSGKWTYTANSAYDNLNVGEQVSDSFTVQSADGSVTSVTVTINGTNDAPQITSAAQAGSVTEDDLLTTSGQVTSSDVDHNATATFSVDTTAGTYGNLALDAATGKWTYTLDNAASQSLNAGEIKTDPFKVTVTDDQGATATQDVVITINGTADAPTFSTGAGKDAGAVTEDAVVPDTTELSTTGKLVVTDADKDQGGIDTDVPPSAASGTLGSLSIDVDGNWTYTVDNSLVQYLKEGETKVETFTVKTFDGTSHDVTSPSPAPTTRPRSPALCRLAPLTKTACSPPPARSPPVTWTPVRPLPSASPTPPAPTAAWTSAPQPASGPTPWTTTRTRTWLKARPRPILSRSPSAMARAAPQPRTSPSPSPAPTTARSSPTRKTIMTKTN